MIVWNRQLRFSRAKKPRKWNVKLRTMHHKGRYSTSLQIMTIGCYRHKRKQDCNIEPRCFKPRGISKAIKSLEIMALAPIMARHPPWPIRRVDPRCVAFLHRKVSSTEVVQIGSSADVLGKRGRLLIFMRTYVNKAPRS